jgi:hypothetical protein
MLVGTSFGDSTPNFTPSKVITPETGKSLNKITTPIFFSAMYSAVDFNGQYQFGG